MQLLRVRSVTIYWIVFVVMSKEEGSMYRERLHISIILGRMSTSANSVETFRHQSREIKGLESPGAAATILLVFSCSNRPPPPWTPRLVPYHSPFIRINPSAYLRRSAA